MNAIHDVIFTVLAISVPEFMLFISVDLLEPFINKYVLHFHTEIKLYTMRTNVLDFGRIIDEVSL